MRKWLSITAVAAGMLARSGPADGAVVFSQDFSSSTNTADYVSATPGIGQFSSIGTTGAAMVVSAADGVLSYNRTGSNSGSFTRIADFSPTPSAMTVQFDLTITGTAAATSAAVLAVGNGFTTNNTADALSTAHSRLAFNLPASGSGMVLRDIGGSTNSTGTFSGTQTVRWFINDTGSPQVYVGPDGSSESLANDANDVWIGTTRVLNDFAATTAATPLNEFKFTFNGGGSGTGIGTITFDNMVIHDTLVPEPGVVGVIGVAGLGLLARRRRVG